jgi:alkylation response protein AidB-like acyl-CoA dehydrogenase
MDFGFSEDQLLLQTTVRDFLQAECPPDWVRAGWETETGRDPAFWKKLAEIGIPGLLVPEVHGGLGMDDVDLVLLMEEAGRVGLAEPLIPTVQGVGLLRELGNDALASAWLPKVADGAAILTVGLPGTPFVPDAHVADLLFLFDGNTLHALPRDAVTATAVKSGDGSQRLFEVSFSPSDASAVADGDRAQALLDAALDRGAVCCAAQALGVADQLIGMAVDYATQREQFGVAIGTFQAVKHMLAEVKVALEYARSHVYRAAYSVAQAAPSRAVDASMAKLAACEAAGEVSKVSLQVHGAIGYTYEQDVHVWMKRAWSLDRSCGDSVFHGGRLCDAVIDGTLPAESFGYSAPGQLR